MEEAIKLAIVLALPTLAGAVLLKLVCTRTKLPAYVFMALSYGLGMGVLTHCMLLLGAVGIKYSRTGITAFLAIWCLVCTLLIWERRRAASSIAPLSSSRRFATAGIGIMNRLVFIFCAVILGYIIYQIFFVFWRSMIIPVYGWDALWVISFKAKVFFYERSLNCLSRMKLASYPIHVPLMETWMAIVMGKWDEQVVKIFFPFAFLSFTAIYGYFLGQYVSRKWVLMGIAILFSSNFFIAHATVAYRDFFLLYYVCTAIMMLLLWRDRGENAFLLLAAICAGLATFTKTEGTYYLFICGGILLFILKEDRMRTLTEKCSKALLFFLPAIGISMGFRAYRLLFSLPPDERERLFFSWAHLSRFPPFFYKFFSDLYVLGNWNMVWFLLLVSLIVNRKRAARDVRIMLLLRTLAGFIAIWFTAIIFVSHSGYITIISEDSLSRLMLHFFPIVPILIVFLNAPPKDAMRP